MPTKYFLFHRLGIIKRAIIRIGTIFLLSNAGEIKIEWSTSFTEGNLNGVST